MMYRLFFLKKNKKIKLENLEKNIPIQDLQLCNYQIMYNCILFSTMTTFKYKQKVIEKIKVTNRFVQSIHSIQ